MGVGSGGLGGACGTYGEEQQCTLYKILRKKVEGKWPSGTHRCWWENIIKNDLTEIGLGGGVWSELIWHLAGTSGRLLWARLWTCGILYTDLCVNKPVTVPVIFEPPCIYWVIRTSSVRMWLWDQQERGTKPTVVYHENCQHYPYQTKWEKTANTW